MTEFIALVVCGLVLLFSSVLVFQESIFAVLSLITLPHPWDYVMHFVTCFAGVIFFSILIQKFSFGFGSSLFFAVFIMLVASLFKECRLDSYFSVGDMVANILGIGLASFVLSLTY